MYKNKKKIIPFAFEPREMETNESYSESLKRKNLESEIVTGHDMHQRSTYITEKETTLPP